MLLGCSISDLLVMVLLLLLVNLGLSDLVRDSDKGSTAGICGAVVAELVTVLLCV